MNSLLALLLLGAAPGGLEVRSDANSSAMAGLEAVGAATACKHFDIAQADPKLLRVLTRLGKDGCEMEQRCRGALTEDPRNEVILVLCSRHAANDRAEDAEIAPTAQRVVEGRIDHRLHIFHRRIGAKGNPGTPRQIEEIRQGGQRVSFLAGDMVPLAEEHDGGAADGGSRASTAIVLRYEGDPDGIEIIRVRTRPKPAVDHLLIRLGITGFTWQHAGALTAAAINAPDAILKKELKHTRPSTILWCLSGRQLVPRCAQAAYAQAIEAARAARVTAESSEELTEDPGPLVPPLEGYYAFEGMGRCADGVAIFDAATRPSRRLAAVRRVHDALVARCPASSKAALDAGAPVDLIE